MSMEKIDDLDGVIHLCDLIEPRIQTHFLNHNIRSYHYAILLKCFWDYDLEEWNDGVLIVISYPVTTQNNWRPSSHFIVRCLPRCYAETEKCRTRGHRICFMLMTGMFFLPISFWCTALWLNALCCSSVYKDLSYTSFVHLKIQRLLQCTAATLWWLLRQTN